MAQQSSGFSGWVKLGKASTSRAWSALVEGRERDAGLLAVVGEQPALAARLRHGRDAQAARPAPPAEHLERLQQLVEVAHLDRAVVAEQRREGARRADHRARVGERGARSGLRAPDLEADDGLAGLGRARQGGGEGVRAAGSSRRTGRSRACPRPRPGTRRSRRDRARARSRPRRPCESRRAARRPGTPRRSSPSARRRRRARARTLGARHGAEPERDAAGRRDAHAVRARRPPRRTRRRARRCARRPRDPRRRPRRPGPGSTTARTPAAITSSKAASARVCPTSR